MERKASRLEYLDGIKGILSLGIVVLHYYSFFIKNRNPDLQIPSSILCTFISGPGCFFVISGFLLAYTNKDRLRHMNFFTYLKKRWRGLAAFYFSEFTALILTFIDRYMTGNRAFANELSTKDILYAFTFMKSGWLEMEARPFSRVLWYVHVLFLCYLIYYIVAHLNRAGYMAVSAALVILGCWCVTYKPEIVFLTSLNGKGYMGFFLGVLIYEAWCCCRKALPVIWTIVSALALYLGSGRLIYDAYLDSEVKRVVFLFPCLLLWVMALPPLQKLLECRPMKFLGKISMAIYATHYIFFQAIIMCLKHAGIYTEVPLDSLPYVILIGSGTAAVAVLWYYIVEKRIYSACFKPPGIAD